MKWVLAAATMVSVLVGSAVSRAQADVGWLDVASDPAAEVFLDGVDTGRVTPAEHVPLGAGHHRLKLVSTDGTRTRSMGFTVEGGKTTKLTIHLAR